jgi:hypothetical protein
MPKFHERDLLAGFHGAMVLIAVWEHETARTTFRRQLAGGFGGFHLACLIHDLRMKRKEPGGVMERDDSLQPEIDALKRRLAEIADAVRDNAEYIPFYRTLLDVAEGRG